MISDFENAAEATVEVQESIIVTSIAGGRIYKIQNSGIYVRESDKQIFLCSKVIVKALCRNSQSTGWGRVLMMDDYDGKTHEAYFDDASTCSNENDIISKLRSYGVIVTLQKKYFHCILDYLLNTPPQSDIRIRSTQKTGWQEPGIYLFNDNTLIGESTEQYMLQSLSSIHPIVSSGTLEEWKRELAARCSGNSRLMFAISNSFASTLLYHLNLEGGGFHLFGTSSDGKTTTLHVAASVISNPKQYIQPWRATDNGLEGIAKHHNHSLLILDEQGEMTPQDLGKVSYFLSNGKGKIRAKVTGEAKQKAEWLLYYLSSGEMTLGEQIAEAGKQVKAGQEVRHVDIPANAGAGMGVFEQIHDAASPADFADLLKQLAARYHGTAFRCFIERFITADDQRDETIECYMQGFLAANLPEDACGQVKRVAHKFAVVAAAGMLASAWEITGWEPEDVNIAISKLFQDWLAHRSHTGTHESEQIISRFRGYLQLYGVSRIIDCSYGLNGQLTKSGMQRTPQQHDGYRIIKNCGNEYYIFPAAFNSIIKGLNRATTIKWLVENGYLAKGSDGRNQQLKRLPDSLQTRVYCFTSKIMEDEQVTAVTPVTAGEEVVSSGG